jgi:hypothetical protein
MRETRGLAHLKKQFPYGHFQRIETWAGSGIFDLNVCIGSVESWVELKQAIRPKRESTPVKAHVKPGQIAWEHLRRSAGGRTFVGLTLGSEFLLLPGFMLKNLSVGVSQQELISVELPLSALEKSSFVQTVLGHTDDQH